MRQSRSKPRLISQPVLTSASNMLHDPRFGPGTQEPLSASLAAGRPRPVFNSKGLTVVIPAQRQSLLHVPLQASPSPVTPVSCAPHTMGDHTPNAQPHDHTPTAPCAASARTPRAPPKVLRHRPTTSLFESPSSPQPFKLRSAIKNRASHILKHTSIAPSVESEPEPELESRWSSSEDEDDVDDSDSGYAPSWLSRRRSISSRRAPTPSIRSQATSKTAKSSASIRSFCTRTISRSATPLPQIISSEIESPGGCPTTGRRSRRILGSIRNHLTPRKNRCQEQQPPSEHMSDAPLARHMSDNRSSLSLRLRKSKVSKTPGVMSSDMPKRPPIPVFDPPLTLAMLLPPPGTPSPLRPPRPPWALSFGAGSLHAPEPVRTTTMSKNNTASSTSRGQVEEQQKLLPSLPVSADNDSGDRSVKLLPPLPTKRPVSGRLDAQPDVFHSSHGSSNDSKRDSMYLHDNIHVQVSPFLVPMRNMTEAEKLAFRGEYCDDKTSPSPFQLPPYPFLSSAPPSPRSSPRLSPSYMSKAKSLLNRHHSDSDSDSEREDCPRRRSKSRHSSSSSRKLKSLSKSSFSPSFRSLPSSPEPLPSLTPDLSHSSNSSFSSLSSSGADHDFRSRLHIGEPIPPSPRTSRFSAKLQFTSPPALPSTPKPLPPSPGGLRCPRRANMTPTTPKRERKQEPLPPHLARTPPPLSCQDLSLALQDCVAADAEEKMYLTSNASVNTFGGVDFSEPWTGCIDST